MATSTRKRKPKASSNPETAPQASIAAHESDAEQATKAGSTTKAKRTSIAEQLSESKPPAAAEQPSMAAHGEHTNGNSPTREDIERRAYELFIARGAIHGNDLEDWFRAEQEFRN